MKKLILGLVLTSTFCISHGQTLLLMGEDSSYVESNFMLELDVGVDYRSNALTNEFTDKFIFGGEISAGLKDEVSAELNSMNRGGGNLTAGFKFFNFNDSLFGNAGYGLMIGFGANSHGRMTFSEDFYKLSMYGNLGFAGQTADLGQTSAEYLSWQELGIGFFHKKSLSFIALNFLNGQSFMSFDAPMAEFYTSPDGDEIALTTVGTFERSDTSLTGFGSNNGLGVSMNGRLNLPLKDEKGFVSIQIEDAGFIRWSQETLNYEADTTVEFRGVDLEEAFSDDNSLAFPTFEDSVYHSVEKNSTTTILPARISVDLNHFIGNRSFFNAGVSFVPVPGYVPAGRLGYNRFFGERFYAGLDAHFGGFGNFRLGGQLQWRSESNWYLQFQIYDIPGMFLPEAKGRGAQLTVSKFFKSRND